MFSGPALFLIIVLFAILVLLAIIVTVATRVITIKTITPNTGTGVPIKSIIAQTQNATLTAVTPQFAAGVLTGRERPRLEGSMGAFRVSFLESGFSV